MNREKVSVSITLKPKKVAVPRKSFLKQPRDKAWTWALGPLPYSVKIVAYPKDGKVTFAPSFGSDPPIAYIYRKRIYTAHLDRKKVYLVARFR